MSRPARRIIIPLLVALAFTGVLWTVFNGPRKSTATPPIPPAATAPATASAATTAPATTQPQTPAASTNPAGSTVASNTVSAPASTQPISGLRALAPEGANATPDVVPQSLGSLDPRRAMMEVRLSRYGAGIERIEFANIWQNAIAKRKAQEYFKTLPLDGPIDLAQLPQQERYVLVSRSPSKTTSQQGVTVVNGVPVFALRAVFINGVAVDLLNNDSWGETSPGTFESLIVDESKLPIARIVRRFRLEPASYDISIEQRLVNLTDRPLEVRWEQYGPVDLPYDKTDYIERRRLHFGYQPDPARLPDLVLADDSNVIERSGGIKQFANSLQAPTPMQAKTDRTVWPTDQSRSKKWNLSWFASTSRYFGLSVHPPLAGGKPVTGSLGAAIEEIEVGASNIGVKEKEVLFTVLRGPAVTIAPGLEHAFDEAVFAGPLDRNLLDENGYGALSLSGMIIYSMGGCCSFVTFQWLAHLMLGFLSILHNYVVFDWGLAIIGLVFVVRALLHPLTKKAQINMQRFSKSMAAMKPEIDKVQAKFKDDPKKAQQEQMRLMREHGVNPMQMLGCLPMFLQTPIWIALWAMLYLAFDIRQQPAFYGVFQMFGDWGFLADLSAQDQFISLGKGFTIPLVGWEVTSINLLPLLMGVVFYFSQKYMSPPPTATMTPEQQQQQRIMKIMMVVMMPLVMYPSPSGLTLYMVTSSCIGIMESRYIRKHISELDLNPPKPGEKAAAKKVKDPRGRAVAAAIERLKAKRNEEPPKSFKKRK